jgi:cellulose biosynthesis protein BcsQ
MYLDNKKRDQTMNTNRAKIVTILSRKGGAGKTAITSLVARYFVEIERKDVLIIDFDGRGGITSLFHHEAVTSSTPSIIEILLQANQQANIDDLFFQTVIQIENSITARWKRKRGRLFLLPSKPLLDEILIGMNPGLLKTVLHSLRLSQDCIILIDSGPDSKNIEMCIVAADLVFVPMILGKQDVHPTIETIRSIISAQKENHKPIFGGLIINRAGQSQWEDSYISSYQDLIAPLKKDSGLITTDRDIFIELKQSRIIQRGKHLSWSWRNDHLNTAREIAEIVHKSWV